MEGVFFGWQRTFWGGRGLLGYCKMETMRIRRAVRGGVACALMLGGGMGWGSAQGFLPLIGSETLPEDDAAICAFCPMQDNWQNTQNACPHDDVPMPGEMVHDFVLWDLDGEPFHLSEVLAEGKYVYLVNGAATCPVFRNRIAELNQLVVDLDGQPIEFRVVYTIDPHPQAPDISPYSGNVWPMDPPHAQPTTYGARKDLALSIYEQPNPQDLSVETLNVRMLIDEPCNSFWENMSRNANEGLLIAPNGRLLVRQHWFNYNPGSALCLIQSAMGLPVTGGCGVPNAAGVLAALPPQAPFTSLPVGTTAVQYLTLVNAGGGPLGLDIARMVDGAGLPAGTTTSMCTGAQCLAPGVSSTSVVVPQGASMLFGLHFYAGQTPGTSALHVAFSEPEDPFATPVVCTFPFEVTGAVVPEEGAGGTPLAPGEAVSVAQAADGSGDAEGPGARPNPATDRVLLLTGGDVAEWAVHDGTGRCMERGGRTSGNLLLETSDWPAGTYHWTAVGASGAPLRIRFVVL